MISYAMPHTYYITLIKLCYAMLCYAMPCSAMLSYNTLRNAMVWYGMVWYGMVWYGMVRARDSSLPSLKYAWIAGIPCWHILSGGMLSMSQPSTSSVSRCARFPIPSDIAKGHNTRVDILGRFVPSGSVFIFQPARTSFVRVTILMTISRAAS